MTEDDRSPGPFRTRLTTEPRARRLEWTVTDRRSDRLGIVHDAACVVHTGQCWRNLRGQKESNSRNEDCKYGNR